MSELKSRKNYNYQKYDMRSLSSVNIFALDINAQNEQGPRKSTPMEGTLPQARSHMRTISLIPTTYQPSTEIETIILSTAEDLKEIQLTTC